MVKLDPTDIRTPVLQWYNITKGEQYGGELLAAFELLQVSFKVKVMEGSRSHKGEGS